MKNSRLKILLLVLAMVFSTFASGMTQSDPIPGNDGGGYDSDETFYFDENGNEVDGPTDYWVSFEVDGQYLSFTSNNVIVTSVTVKGGNAHYIYTDLDESESGMHAPLVGNIENNGGNIPDISHFNFTFEIDEVPPPPVLGQIEIEKYVIDEEEEPIDDENEFEFKVEKKVGDQWVEIEESPVLVEAGDSLVIPNLPLGEYRITEEDKEGYTLHHTINTTPELTQEDRSEVVEFTNMKDDDTPPPPDKGSLKVHKRIMRSSGSIDANLGDGEFTVKLTGPNDYEETKVIQKPGEYVTFDNLPFGTYTLEEIEAYDPELEFSDYFFANSGNQNYEVISDEVEIDSTNEVQVWLINEVGEEPWMGEIRVVKTVDDPRDEDPSLAGFEFSLYKVEGEDEDLVETLTTGTSGGIVFDGLTEGHYVLYETNLLWFYEGIDLDGEEIHLNEETAPNGYIQINVENERYYPEEWMGEIRVVKTVDDPRDSTPSLSGFTFELFMIDDEEEIFVRRITTNSTGIIVFEDLEEGQYRLYEQNEPGYDEGISSSGRLINLNPDSAPNGRITIDVENERVYPPPDDDDDDDDRPRPRPEPEEEEEVLEVVVIEELIPEAPPVVEVVEEVIPLATLPKTGSYDPSFFGGIGATLLGLGLLLKKKENR